MSRRTSRRASSLVRATGEPVALRSRPTTHARGRPLALLHRVRTGEPVEPTRTSSPEANLWRRTRPMCTPTAEARRSRCRCPAAHPEVASEPADAKTGTSAEAIDRPASAAPRPAGRPKSATRLTEPTVLCRSRRRPAGVASSDPRLMPTRVGRWHRSRRFALTVDASVERRQTHHPRESPRAPGRANRLDGVARSADPPSSSASSTHLTVCHLRGRGRSRRSPIDLAPSRGHACPNLTAAAIDHAGRRTDVEVDPGARRSRRHRMTPMDQHH